MNKRKRTRDIDLKGEWEPAPAHVFTLRGPSGRRVSLDDFFEDLDGGLRLNDAVEELALSEL